VNGGHIESFVTAWKTATRRIGKPGALFHDFRRTAVGNPNRSGVPVKIAMELVGHKTMAIYHRYNIVDKNRLRAGATKLAQFFADNETKAAEQKVLPIGQAAKEVA